jgi:hypothetical protein
MINENVSQEKPKKTLGGMLSNLLFDKKESENKPVVEKVKEEVKQSPVTPSFATNVNVVGVLNPEIYQTLKKVLEDCNLEGPDYLELKNSFEAMKSFLPDESQRLIAAFASLKATSPKLTKKIVTDSIDKYIGFIEVEKNGSENEFKLIYENEVLSKQKSIDDKNTEIEKLKEVITKSQESIMKLSQEINTTSGEMLSKQNELDIKKKNFDITVETIINELKTDKTKIETLIQE